MRPATTTGARRGVRRLITTGSPGNRAREPVEELQDDGRGGADHVPAGDDLVPGAGDQLGQPRVQPAERLGRRRARHHEHRLVDVPQRFRGGAGPAAGELGQQGRGVVDQQVPCPVGHGRPTVRAEELAVAELGCLCRAVGFGDDERPLGHGRDPCLGAGQQGADRRLQEHRGEHELRCTRRAARPRSRRRSSGRSRIAGAASRPCSSADRIVRLLPDVWSAASGRAGGSGVQPRRSYRIRRPRARSVRDGATPEQRGAAGAVQIRGSACPDAVLLVVEAHAVGEQLAHGRTVPRHGKTPAAMAGCRR